MLNCRDVSRLVSERMDRKLTFWERLNLGFHLVICRWCAGFAENMDRLHEAAERHAIDLENDQALQDIRLPSDSHDRLQRIIRSEQS